jgi:hypothetical protein
MDVNVINLRVILSGLMILLVVGCGYIDTVGYCRSSATYARTGTSTLCCRTPVGPPNWWLFFAYRYELGVPTNYHEYK